MLGLLIATLLTLVLLPVLYVTFYGPGDRRVTPRAEAKAAPA